MSTEMHCFMPPKLLRDLCCINSWLASHCLSLEQHTGGMVR